MRRAAGSLSMVLIGVRFCCSWLLAIFNLPARNIRPLRNTTASLNKAAMTPWMFSEENSPLLSAIPALKLVGIKLVSSWWASETQTANRNSETTQGSGNRHTGEKALEIRTTWFKGLRGSTKRSEHNGKRAVPRGGASRSCRNTDRSGLQGVRAQEGK